MSSESIGLPPPRRGQPCPCGGGRLFEVCCAPLLGGEREAATAEELMRSRFTAHVAADWRYLHRTHRPTAGKPYIEQEPAESIPWTRLVVHAHEPGPRPDMAFVEFSAFFADETGEGVLREKSEFVRVEGRWLYTRAVRTGPAPVRSEAPKVGRNDPCPCGSGRKYKHCCGGR